MVDIVSVPGTAPTWHSPWQQELAGRVTGIRGHPLLDRHPVTLHGISDLQAWSWTTPVGRV